jgi:hypothetical protein
MGEAGSYEYSVFGLRVQSSLELPELFRAEGHDSPDVIIEQGSVPVTAEDNGVVAAEGGLLLSVPEVGRYLIADGRTIRVEPVPGVPERNVRLFLLGSAFGALLHQRGLLPLHANAVEVGGRAFAFMGHSGAGKSTLAAWFHDNGYGVLADDVCVVRFDDQGQATACAGLPRLRLWLDAIEVTGREHEGLNRSYVGAFEQLDKFDVPVDPSAMIRGEVPLSAIYLLAQGDEFAIEPLTGVDAARALFENTYRGAYVRLASTYRGHWQSSVALAQRTSVYRITRTMNFDRLTSECEALLVHAKEQSRAH